MLLNGNYLQQKRPPFWGACICAVVLVAFAAGLCGGPLQALGVAAIWFSFFPAVLMAAVWGGVGAGLLATVLACLVLFAPWSLPLLHDSPVDVPGALSFALVGLVTCGLVESLRRTSLARQRAEEKAAASAARERFITTMINAIPSMIGYWDKNLRFGFANKAYFKWHGKQPEALIGTPIRDLMGESLYALNEPHIQRALAGVAQHFPRTLTRIDGSVGHILANYIPNIGADGAVEGIFIQANDVTELKEAQAQLELAASVFQNTAEGIAVTNAQGIFLSVNPAFGSITGYAAEEAIGQTPRLLKSNRHDQAFYTAMWQEIAARGRWSGDIWNRRKDGEVYLERMTITQICGPQGEPVRYVSVFSDITDLWRKDEYLKHLAFHDALTDLPNRSLLMELLLHQIAVARRERFGLAVLFIDLDRFKFVNDTFGHEVGDDLLRTVAHRLQLLVRQSDTVARLGGDEFVITLDNPAHRDEVAYVANCVIAAINEPMEFRGLTVQVGASVGIAMFADDGQTPAELIRNADLAMYAAKRAGHNNVRFFELDSSVDEHVRI